MDLTSGPREDQECSEKERPGWRSELTTLLAEQRVAVAAERLRRDIREAIDVCYGELGDKADSPEDVAGVERAIAHDMATVLDWIAAAARGTANTERGSE